MAWEKLGSTKVASELGTAGNGTNNGITLDTSTEKLGAGAYVFDGTNDYIETSNTSDWEFLSNGSAWSVAFWFKDDSTTQTSKICNTMQDQSGSNKGISINHESNGGLGISVYPSDSGYPFASAVADVFTDTGVWHHYAVVFDGANTATVYKDGTSKGTLTKGGNFTAGAPQHSLNLGRRADNAARWLDGTLDDFAIWSSALDISEITDLVNAPD